MAKTKRQHPGNNSHKDRYQSDLNPDMEADLVSIPFCQFQLIPFCQFQFHSIPHKSYQFNFFPTLFTMSRYSEYLLSEARFEGGKEEAGRRKLKYMMSHGRSLD